MSSKPAPQGRVVTGLGRLLVCATVGALTFSLGTPPAGAVANVQVVDELDEPASIDLQLSKTVDVDPLVWNAASLDYTLTVTNAGPEEATGVVLSDAIPGHVPGATGVSAGMTGGTSNATFGCTTGSTVTCTQTGGTIAAGATAVFTITVARPLVDSSAQPGGKWTNTASVASADQGDLNLSNNSASVQVAIDPVTDLSVDSSVMPASARAGTEATVVLTVGNHGPSTARSVSLSEVFTMPSGTMTFVSATPSAGSCAPYDEGTGTLSCSLGDIVADGSATVAIVVRPDHMVAPPAPRAITGDATVSSTTPDSDPQDNSAQSVLTVTQASVDLVVDSVDSPDPLGFVPASAGPVFPDDVVTYRNVITNRGPSVASGLVLFFTMTPPSGKSATFLGDKLTASGQLYASHCDNLYEQVTGPATLHVTCTFPHGSVPLAEDATTDLYLDFRIDSVPSTGGDDFATTAYVWSDEPESAPDDNLDEQTTTVRMLADLQLATGARAFDAGSDSAITTAQVRQPFYWVMTLTNAGPGDSQVTQITDTLPSGVSLYDGGSVAPYDSAPYTSGTRWATNNGTPTSGTCVGTTTITCDVGLLESGKVATVRVPVVSTTAGSRLGCASATTSEVDPSSANNSACSAVEVRESGIAGTVYADKDDTGTKGVAETGINGVTVELTGTDAYGNAVSTSTTTSSSGAFSFLHLADGTYALTETQPGGFRDGKDTAGTSGGGVAGTGVGSDAITAISLSRDTAATDYLFGELPVPATPVVSDPADGGSVTTTTPTVRGSADPETTVTVLLDGTAVGTAPAGSDGSWTFPVPTALSHGEHTVSARATDAVGTTSDLSVPATFTVGPDDARDFDVTIHGARRVHRVMRAVLAPAVAPGATVTWTWSVGGQPRPGVTGSAYRAGLADLGKRVVARATVSEPGHLVARAHSTTRRVRLQRLAFAASPLAVPRGNAIMVTGRHLLPGQRYVVRFGIGRVLARGRVPARAESIRRSVWIPGNAAPELRRLVLETEAPHRARSVFIRVTH